MIPNDAPISVPELSPEIDTSEAGFERLFQEIRPRLLRLARSLTSNHAAAKDIVQKTTDEALEEFRAGKFKIGTIAKASSYLATKAYWRSIDHVRAVDRDRALTESQLEGEDDENGIGNIPPEDPDPEVVEVLDVRALLEKVSADLSQEEWIIFSMMSQGHSAKEVSKVVGKTPNHIGQIRFQVHLRIQEKYGASTERARRINDAPKRQYQGLCGTTGTGPREGSSALRGADQPSGGK